MELVDRAVLETVAEMRVGSSPTRATMFFKIINGVKYYGELIELAHSNPSGLKDYDFSKFDKTSRVWINTANYIKSNFDIAL